MLLIFTAGVVAPCCAYGAEGNVPPPVQSSAAIKLEIVPGQPGRLPMGLGLAGQPPTAVITASAEASPSAELVLVGYRAGKEVSRHPVALPEKPYSARIQLDEWPAAVALWGKSAPGAKLVELARQKLPELKPESWRSRFQGDKVQITKTTEVLLSGPDWKLGSFPMGQGERAQAYLPTFDDSKFRTVHVPGEVQAQMGFKGDHLYPSRELTLLNEQEWWYRKTFVPAREDKDKAVRLLFEGVDYFATVWLNGEKLGENEGSFVQFSTFDIGEKLQYGKENLLVVKVTCPWVPKDGRGFLEYLKGDLAFTLYQGNVSIQFPFPPYRLGPYFHESPGCGNTAFPMGLFRDVKLVASGTIAINDLFVRTERLNPDGSATLAVSGKINNQSDQEIVVTLAYKITPDNFKGEEVRFPAQSLTLRPGENTINTEMEVKDPQLWWTWDTGPQNLYGLTARISLATGAATDSRSVAFGIRTIERHQDMGYWLNGQRLFLKGGYYPTGGYFLSTESREDYEKDLELLRAANLNSVTLLTIVENADFFDLCDRLGIVSMVEFPMNQWGPMEVVYPDVPEPQSGVVVQKVTSPRRETYIEESLRQFRQIMIQLRNHPSIIVWIPFAEAGDSPYGEYGHLIRKLVKEYAPGAIYHPSICNAGEHHYWEGNAGMEGWEGYQTHFNANAGFVSEYG
ncbi:MAG: sugar-binding domain-containing protein, partial [Syntrophales bacterium]